MEDREHLQWVYAPTLGPFRWVKIKKLRQTSANFGKLRQTSAKHLKPSANIGKLQQTSAKTHQTFRRLRQPSATISNFGYTAMKGRVVRAILAMNTPDSGSAKSSETVAERRMLYTAVIPLMGHVCGFWRQN